MDRFEVTYGVEEATCPHCGATWRIAYYGDHMLKIRGPAWDKMKKFRED
jgi:hypothetical protein